MEVAHVYIVILCYVRNFQNMETLCRTQAQARPDPLALTVESLVVILATFLCYMYVT